jgi:hypothetical protein
MINNVLDEYVQPKELIDIIQEYTKPKCQGCQGYKDDNFDKTSFNFYGSLCTCYDSSDEYIENPVKCDDCVKSCYICLNKRSCLMCGSFCKYCSLEKGINRYSCDSCSENSIKCYTCWETICCTCKDFMVSCNGCGCPNCITCMEYKCEDCEQYLCEDCYYINIHNDICQYCELISNNIVCDTHYII